MKFYLRMEGVNLANFVNDTQDLSTVRGGSLLLLQAVDEIRHAAISAQLTPVTTGASSGLFQFDAADNVAAVHVRQEVEVLLNRHPQFQHATFVVDVEPAGEDFVRDREALLAHNRWRQMQQPIVPIPAWNTHAGVDACEIDRVRPATRSMSGPEGIERVSTSVEARRTFGRQQKQQFYARQTGVDSGRDFAYHFSELTSDPERGNLHHKMAVIYLDGNGFGRLQNQQCSTAERQQQFDSTVKDYRKGLLANLLQTMEQEQDGWLTSEGRYRLETLLWGGDEIIWVVPAWQGWTTLSLFYQQSRSWQFAGQKLTHAAGMVFCHYKAPIHRLTVLARDLAELAKEASRRQENMFAYLVLESFDHVGRDLREFLRERYGAEPTACVLAGDGMTGINEAFAQLKRDETFSRRQFYQLVYRGQKQSSAATAGSSIEVPASDALRRLRDYFGHGDIGWSHIADLWDYLGTA